MTIPYTYEQVLEMAKGQGYVAGTGTSVTFSDDITSQVKASSNFSSGVTNTSNTTQIIDGICEGPIEGWPTSEPMKHVYLDGTPIKSYNNTINTGNIRFEFKNGTSDQAPLSQYTIIGAVKSPNWLNEIEDVNKSPTTGAIIQQVQIRDDTDGAYPPVEAVAFTFTFPEGLFRYRSNGGRDSTPCGIKIELNNKADGSGPTWFTKVYDLWNQEITGGNFEVTYIVEIPPGWSTAAGLQEYSDPNFADDIVQFRISKFDSDHTNERAHSKLYLKNYSIYTRNQFSFPYTALAGLTIDSRNFDGSVPTRMYDLKLLKVRVPSNYTTTVDSKTGNVIERKYTGVWDGTFKSTLEWTDNPAWCFYDLVTNERYGLGKYVDPSLLNKWALYEIAKYCDAVETEGANQVFRIGTPTNSTPRGGVASGAGNSLVKEPRFTCNLLIKDREEAYSVVQRMASLFRGIVYFQHGQLKVIQDKEGTPTYAFNNTNVIDGTFAYSSSSAKARHTVAIVRWLDPDDLYSEKLEYVEDYDGMARYGYREIEIDGFGCTSKGQARRIGRHILITEKFELETVSFKTGMEGATVTVGSLIKIKDSMRQLKRAGGRIVSATSNSITVDSTINIPANVVLSSIKLWVELPYASQDLLADGTYSNDNLKPSLQSYTLSGVSAGTNYNTFTISTPSTFNYNVNGVATTVTPTAGNIWLISYDTYVSGTSGPTVAENTSVYKVLSVVENNNYEYEITALQSDQTKYTAIEAYSPLPEYAPPQYKLTVPTPSEGWFSVTPSGKNAYAIKVSWRLDRNISGTKYKVAIKQPSAAPRVLANGTLDTSYTFTTRVKGNYYFYIYTLDTKGKQVSSPLIIGPISVKEVLPQNNFDTFNQSFFTSDSITNTWVDDEYPNDTLAFEVWRNSTNSLRSTPVTNKTISAIDYNTKTITLNNFDQTVLTDPVSSYRVESPIYPYIKYKAVNLNKLGTVANTSTTLVVLESIEKPDVSIGDKVFNATRSNNPTVSDNPKATNVVAVTFTNPVPGTWFTQITVSPPVTSQTTGDTIYIYKGVMGVGLKEIQPSARIKQKTFKSVALTTTTTIKAGLGAFTNVLAGDIVINKTRGASRTVVTKVDNQTITVAAVTGQVPGDWISIYQYPAGEGSALAKFKIDYLFPAFGGDKVILKDVFDSTLISQSQNMILVNLTRSRAAEVFSTQSSVTGIEVNYWPSIPSAADNDEVILLQKNEVFLPAVGTYIHPTAATCAAGTTSSTIVTSTAFFSATSPSASAVVGDIIVNATRNRSAVIVGVTSTTQATIVGSVISDFVINGQTTGDIIFVVKASDIASGFNEKLAYSYPTPYTNTNASTTVVIATNIVTQTGVTNSYILYNATRNAYSAITSVSSPSTINLTTPITGQTNGDRVYVFLPNMSGVSAQTVVTAPDGAFKHARPGDIFWNKTRDQIRTILDVTTLTGAIDKKIDRLTLNSAITSQSAGDEFIILQGYYSGTPTAFTDNGSNDKISLQTITGLGIGDTVSIHRMNATRIGVTSGNSLVDSGLDPSTTYYYWMRVVNPARPFVVGPWKPSDTTGDSATTLPLNIGNYSTSNDNDGTAITIPITGSVIAATRNKDSTYDVSLQWEWLGNSRTLDGFTLYFWSSGSSADDATIIGDDDYIKAQTGYSVARKVGAAISAAKRTASSSQGASLTAGLATVTGITTTGLVVGQKVTGTGLGVGSGLIVNYTARKGEIRRVSSIVNGGTKYNVGDILTVPGGTGGTVTVTNLNSVGNIITCSSTTLTVGQPISVSGTFTNGSIVGHTGTVTYYIISTNGSTTFSLSTIPGGTSVTLTNGTGAGPTFTKVAAGGTIRVTATNGSAGVVTGAIVHTIGAGGYTSSNSVSLTTFYYSAGPYIVSIDSATQVTLSVTHASTTATTLTFAQVISVASGHVGMSRGDPIRISATSGFTNLNNTSTTTTVTGTDHYILTSVTTPLSGVTLNVSTGDFTCTTNSLFVGQKVILTGTNTGALITGYSSGTSYYIISTNGTTTFRLSTTVGGSSIAATGTTGSTGLTFSAVGLTFNPTPTVTGTYTSGGVVVPCKYSYTVHNITANYYFNAWAQPYRAVNTATSENGVITGDVRMVYNG